jgi:hypothetical protein
VDFFAISRRHEEESIRQCKVSKAQDSVDDACMHASWCYRLLFQVIRFFDLFFWFWFFFWSAMALAFFCLWF